MIRPGRPKGKKTNIDYIREEDFIKLQNADLIDWKYRLIYRLLYNSAFRIGEPLNSKVEHIIKDFNNESKLMQYFLILPTQKSGVENEFVPILPEDYNGVRDYIQSENKTMGDYIFTGQKGKHTESYINEKFKQHCKLLGITRNYTTHSFRKSFVTRKKREGYDYDEIADITRHESITVMRKHYDKEIKARAYEMLIGKRKPKVEG